ncbi:MAG: molecular chaperone HtpG, partial [Alphaproteobacteria bacterium]|nr:molecular chaperone HtpG [Alphaproteobacteria bacterium]
YTSLLFIPTQKPFDLFQPDRKTKLKLYVNRVFISDDIQDLLPPYLRFVQGVVDSSDLPLNVSREMLQNNPVLAKIKAGLVTKILSELEKLANNDSEKFKEFYEQFGAVLKEGLYEDQDHKDKLLSLARFASSQKDTLISLDDYVSKMKKDQENIYYISGESKEALLKSPHLEGFKAQNIDVLLLTDPVDEFWIPMIGSFKDKTFKSITRSGDDLSKLSKEPESPQDKEATSQSEALIAFLKVELKDHVKDVRSTTRLVDSLAVLASDEGDMDIYFEKLMKHHQKLDIASKRILEINPKHPLIKKLTQIVDDKSQQQLASNLGYLILDSARILEGETVINQQDFQRRMADVMLKAL